MKKLSILIGILIEVSIGTLEFISLPAQAQPLAINLLSKPSISLPYTLPKQLPPAPPTTPPPNRTRSGGSLGDESTCAAGNETLVALVPADNPVLTTEEHPTFLFYVPYGADQVQHGEFSILIGPHETTRLYQSRFTLPNQPGIVSVSLPNSPDSALKDNTSYHWYFKLYCNGSTTADLQVDGWVQRTALTPDRQRQIQAASPEVWYDALALLANQMAATPQDANLQMRWRNLLAYINASGLAQVPLAGGVNLEN